MTRSNNTGPSWSRNWNEYNVNKLTRNNWRASLVPAAAVIPAPIAYIKVVAVKKFVVGIRAILASARRKTSAGRGRLSLPEDIVSFTRYNGFGTRLP